MINSMTKEQEFLQSVAEWRGKDKHTGIGVVPSHPYSIPYTYEHLPNRDDIETRELIYRIEAYTQFCEPTPYHRNVYYCLGAQLDEFMVDHAQVAEIILDIRPISLSDVIKELSELQQRAKANAL